LAGKKKKKRNVVRFPGRLHLNIGVVLFAFIAIYIAFNFYSYLTAEHISPYEVEQGTIELNTSYTGLIVRSETVVTAEHSGRLDYYLKDNTKAGVGTLVCSVDESGNVSDKISAAGDAEAVLTEDNLNELWEDIRKFANNYEDESFYSSYAFKADLSGRLMEAINLTALDAISDYTDYAKNSQTFHLYHAGQPGIVAYYTDGMESVTAENFTSDMFDESAYAKKSLKTSGEVQAGEAVYKLITDEDWQIILPVDEDVAASLTDGVVEIRFKEDNATSWTNFTLEEKDGQSYLILQLHNSMIRYAGRRYVDVDLLLHQQTGLKIPNSSITTKTFELIPNEYFLSGNDSSQTGLMVEHLLEDGSFSDAEFIPVTVYYKNEEESYISEEDIRMGDRVVLQGSTDRYLITAVDKLRGVYNINKGYAVFRLIEELYHNDDYCIIKSGTPYGITIYDHIALDGDSTEEGQMIGK